VFNSLYGVVVRGEMLWEYFSWSSDDDNQNEFDVRALLIELLFFV
jgi:hypothetical protein